MVNFIDASVPKLVRLVTNWSVPNRIGVSASLVESWKCPSYHSRQITAEECFEKALRKVSVGLLRVGIQFALN